MYFVLLVCRGFNALPALRCVFSHTLIFQPGFRLVHLCSQRGVSLLAGFGHHTKERRGAGAALALSAAKTDVRQISADYGSWSALFV